METAEPGRKRRVMIPKEGMMKRVPAWLANLAMLRRRWRALIEAWRDPRTPALARVLLVAAALYVVSPVDLVPDTFAGLGWLDDLAILPLALMAFFRMTPGRGSGRPGVPA